MPKNKHPLIKNIYSTIVGSLTVGMILYFSSAGYSAPSKSEVESKKDKGIETKVEDDFSSRTIKKIRKFNEELEEFNLKLGRINLYLLKANVRGNPELAIREYSEYIKDVKKLSDSTTKTLFLKMANEELEFYKRMQIEKK